MPEMFAVTDAPSASTRTTSARNTHVTIARVAKDILTVTTSPPPELAFTNNLHAHDLYPL
jgi:hypothetical protein